MTGHAGSLRAWAVTSALIAGMTVPAASPMAAQEQPAPEYRVLATSRTSTMEKELNEAAAEGYRFAAVMGGSTAGGDETVVVVSRTPGDGGRFEYRLLAANRTSTMQQELQQAADLGFEYRGQTVFDTLFGGNEVIVILERDVERTDPPAWEYLLLATNRTSTMERELQDAARRGYELVGLTVATTALGGNELVSIIRRGRQGPPAATSPGAPSGG